MIRADGKMADGHILILFQRKPGKLPRYGKFRKLINFESYFVSFSAEIFGSWGERQRFFFMEN